MDHLLLKLMLFKNNYKKLNIDYWKNNKEQDYSKFMENHNLIILIFDRV